MGRLIGAILVLALLIGGAGGFYWIGAREGWFGEERDAGVIQGKQIPAAVIGERTAQVKAAAPEGANDQILFGDLHVHTTFSADAFQFSLPIMGGPGVHPVADACDFARYCSALDFWSITDHAETVTPLRWKRTKDAIRACQKIAGDDVNPDLISFIGFEWTQVGRTPSDHFGHKNVIFRDLDDDKLAVRAIGAAGVASAALRTSFGISPVVPLLDFSNRQTYFDFNKFTKLTQAVPECDAKTPSNELPKDCYETANTPGDLVRKLYDEQKLQPLVIPHGSSWGFYTPPGTNWNKALLKKERPDTFKLIEIYSGHGSSEEYRSWKDVDLSADGKTAKCPQPTSNYTPSCWRAGEIIRERCLKAGVSMADCDKRASDARQNYADMGVAGHLSIGGETPEDWLDAGQCTDCFIPPFNHRASNSVQAGLATSSFEDASVQATRFQWGFIGSSDNHRARPGTGYKAVDRHRNTEAGGAVSEFWRKRLLPDQGQTEPVSKRFSREELTSLTGFQLTEFERQSSFWLAGGLAAVHVTERSRDAVWDSLQRREVYATSGPRILLWFNAVDAQGNKIPMGSRVPTDAPPTFEVKAVGAFKQKPGCPDFEKAGLDEKRIKSICSGECYNPSDERRLITRIEVVKIRPQTSTGEDLGQLIEDRYLVHTCRPNQNGCTFSFTDPEYGKDKRDTIYYVKAIQEAEPAINAQPVKCERDGNGKCVKATLCYGDYRSGEDGCTAPAEHRAWSSPIYLDYRVATPAAVQPAMTPAQIPAAGDTNGH
ncbi:MAG: DUF3604 domain-containing protein [Micropepsaceae bacterium]